MDEIIAYATKARKSSIVSLEEDLEKAGDKFLQKALSLAVDGTDLQELRKMMELEIAQSEQHRESAAKVFEAAGGYAPTIGIIGAVLGLIQVMKHLENIEEVGKGIAVAFVATVYGVAVANLVFLPAANKLKARIRQDAQDKELMLEGVCSIVEGMNPKLIRVKLEAFLQHEGKSKKKADAEAPAGGAGRGQGLGRKVIKMPRPKHAEHENHERWLVSYADFITLLFAFFVVMFASSQTDKGKAKQVSEAVEKALRKVPPEQLPPAVAKVLGGTVDDKGQGNAQMHGPGGAKKAAKEDRPEVMELGISLKMLSTQLAEEIKQGKVEVSMTPRGIVVSLKQAAFFPSGTDAVEPATMSTMEKVAAALKSVENPVRIEGHTDSVPIHTPRFRSNWDLSAARSIAIMEVLANRFEIPSQRLSIAGYADTAPVAGNDTPEGRARNRRVDLVILNDYAIAKTEPAQVAPVKKK